MIVVLGAFDDPAVDRFAADLGRPSVVIRADDLHTPGWSLDPAEPGASRLVAGGCSRRCDELSAVVCALPAMTAREVEFIRPPDRAYVAAEFTALLMALFSGLSCPVLNAPTAGCLCGPGWPAEKWALLARSIGINAWPLRRAGPRSGGPSTWLENDPSTPVALVTVVGDEVLDDPAGELVDHTRRLAKAAGLALLTASFAERHGRHVLVGVEPWPYLAQPGLAAAVRGHLDSLAA